MKKIILITVIVAGLKMFGQDPCKGWKSEDNDPKMNIKIAQLCKEAFDKNTKLVGPKGTYFRHILYAKWEVNVDALGNPTEKYQLINIIFKDKKGICKHAVLPIRRQYEGGGKYGAMYYEQDMIASGGELTSPKVDCECGEKLTDWLNSNAVKTGSSSYDNSKNNGNSVTKANEAYEAGLTEYEKNKEKGNGPYKAFNSEGKVTEEGEYKKGKKQGLWKSYEVDGNIRGKDYYTDGNFDSTFSYSSKVLRTVARYKDNKKHGRQEEYRSNGKPQKIETYKNGVLEGKYVEYKEDGTIYTEGNYEEGKKQGRWIRENGSGDLAEGNYVDGEQDGEWTVKDRKTGKLIRTEKYVMGEEKK